MPDEPDIEAEWFDNPRAARERLIRDVRQELTAESPEDVVARHSREFVGAVVASHAPLRGHEALVQEMFDLHLADDLSALKVGEARVKLVELAEQEMRQRDGPHHGTDGARSADDTRGTMASVHRERMATRRGYVMGADGGWDRPAAAPAPAPKPEPEYEHMGDVINARRAARRARG